MPPRPTEVLPLPWRSFLKKMSTDWEPGQHWAVIVPTGGGKTTFLGGLAKTRRFVLGLDIKGGDRTLRELGWPRMEKWPPSRAERRDIADGQPFRRLIGGTGRSPGERQQRYDFCKIVLEAIMEEPGWTALCTDLKVLTAAKFGGAGDQIEELMILARDALTTMMVDMQRGAGVPREAIDQAYRLAVGYTRDVDHVNRLAEEMGRSRAEMRGAISALGELPHGFLIVDREPRSPILLTRPEAL